VRLFEYEVKELFRKEGIPCLEGILMRKPEDATGALEGAPFPVVLKAQVLTGGRGKAGGILFADDLEQAASGTAELFAKEIKGYPVSAVLAEKKLAIAKEFYLGVTIDRKMYKQTIMASASGGVDIEEAARKDPASVIRCDLDPDQRFFNFLGVSLGKAVGFRGKELKAFSAIAGRLISMFRRYDAKLLEINPLVLTTEGELVAADARMSVDDDALFRQKRLAALKLEDRHEEGSLTPREKQAREWGIPYLDLDGDIGMFPGGAGFGIMGNDFIVHYGGRPANFMDSGGGPSPERIAKMLVLLDENPGVKAIFGARFGGISRCDDFAKGVVKFLKEHGLSKPMVMRMTGNMWREGLAIFEEEKKAHPEIFERVRIYGIETPIEEVAREAIAVARSRPDSGE
jgi:succinyl-CoA synthetase beta subunit